MKPTKLRYLDIIQGIDVVEQSIKTLEVQALVNRLMLTKLKEELKNYSPPKKPIAPMNPHANPAID